MKEDLECLQAAQLGFQPKTVAYTHTISTMKTIEDNKNIAVIYFTYINFKHIYMISKVRNQIFEQLHSNTCFYQL